MKIQQISPLVHKFKNKEEFCNKIIQEIMLVSKNNKTLSNDNVKLNKLIKIEKKLIEKNNKLDSLLEQSKNVKKELYEKINIITEENDSYKNILINKLSV